MQDMASDILNKFLSIIQVQVFDALKKNQARIAWRKELLETKKYKELDDKMASIEASLQVLREDINAKDKVLITLEKIKSRQLTHYVDLEDEIIKADFDLLKETLAPYNCLIRPLEEIRMIQSSLVSQGRLKKLPMPYDEISDTLKQVTASLARLTEKMESLISYAMRSLEKVA